ncbi:MAG: DUF3488 and transglutaminase-like domain-containing protein [Frankiaceae bacterium]
MTERDRLSLCTAVATLLTSSALFAVFRDGRWLPSLAAAIAVVAGGSIAARHLRLPRYLGPVLPVAGVTGYLTLLFASAAAVGGFLPGPAAIRSLRATADQGFADIAALAPPVPTRPGLLLITVAGVALVAMAADLLATTLRQPPAAGLPLLALFAVPAAVAPRGSGVVPFGLAVSGYLLLLAADGRTRLARWGRSLGPSNSAVSRLTAVTYGEEPPTGAMGRRIGLTAIGLAFLVPLGLPSLHAPLLGGNGGAGAGAGGRGGNSVTTYNPIVRLHDELTTRQPVTLLKLRTEETTPAGYLRMAGLDVFDGRTWSQSSLRAGIADRVSQGQVLPAAPKDAKPVMTRIAVTDRLDARWLPLPYQPNAVRIDGDWRYETRTDTVFSTRDNTRGRTYEVDSSALDVKPAVLNTAELELSDKTAFAPTTAYPTDLPPIIKRTADSIVTKASASTSYQRALALQQFFRSGEFRYSLKVPAGNSDDAIVRFLQAKQGFCEQFAATMALFARMEGIPARVAVGFTYGKQSAAGEHVVTTLDAHAWPELYFSKAGWLPFEPTPVAGRGEAAPPSYSVAAVGPDGLTTSAGGGKTKERSLYERRFGNLDKSSEAAVPVPTSASGASTGTSRLRLLGWLGLLPVLLAGPGLGRAMTRRRRWRSADSPTATAHAAWADLREDARDVGLIWPASATPRGAAGWLRTRIPLSAEAGTALDELVRAEERARYQRDGVATQVDLRQRAATLRSALQASVSCGQRWRARLVPVSGSDRLRLLTSRLAVAGDRYDRNLARWIRSTVTRRSATP